MGTTEVCGSGDASIHWPLKIEAKMFFSTKEGLLNIHFSVLNKKFHSTYCGRHPKQLYLAPAQLEM